MDQFFNNIWNIVSMIFAAVISFFFTILFKGGPRIFYENDKFIMRRALWVFLIQFFGSIGVYILTFYFCNGHIFGDEMYKSFLPFLLALMPVEITIVLLIILIHRIWMLIIKKVDPSFEEGDPLEKLKSLTTFTKQMQDEDGTHKF